MNKNSFKWHLVEGPVTRDFALHLRARAHTPWFWKCIGMAFGHFFWALTISRPRLLAHVCSGPQLEDTRKGKRISRSGEGRCTNATLHSKLEGPWPWYTNYVIGQESIYGPSSLCTKPWGHDGPKEFEWMKIYMASYTTIMLPLGS